MKHLEEMRSFQLAMFKSGVPHIDIPQDMAFIGVLYKYAMKFNIKTILNGGNLSTEGVKPPLKYFYWGTDMAQIRDILSKFSSNKLKTYPFSSILLVMSELIEFLNFSILCSGEPSLQNMEPIMILIIQLVVYLYQIIASTHQLLIAIC